MKQTHTCQVVGEEEKHAIETDFFSLTEFSRRQMVAETFVLRILKDAVEKVFGDDTRVMIDGHEFKVRWSLSDRNFTVRPRSNEFLCTFRDFPIEEWREGVEVRDVVSDFIRDNWKPEHGFEVFARFADDYYVQARVTAWGLRWDRISKDRYEEGKTASP